MRPHLLKRDLSGALVPLVPTVLSIISDRHQEPCTPLLAVVHRRSFAQELHSVPRFGEERRPDSPGR